jgi:hypothetical protein
MIWALWVMSRYPDVVVGDEDADARLGEPAHDALDLVHGDRVYPGEGLVEEEEFRLEGEGAAISVRRRSPPERV